MTKAVLRIRRNTDAALADMGKRFTAAWKSGKSSAHVFTFESPRPVPGTEPQALGTPRAIAVPRTLEPAGLARSLERDVKRVHEDVAALIDVGLIEKTEHGRIHVPFEVIEADFELRAA